MLSSVARLVGGPLGGLVLGVRGIDGVLLADAATFAAVAALFALRPPRATGRRAARAARAARRRPRLGARGSRSSRARRCCAARSWWSPLAALAQGAFVVLFVLFVVRDLGASEADVGVLRGVQAVGSIAGGRAADARRIRRTDPGRLLARLARRDRRALARDLERPAGDDRVRASTSRCSSPSAAPALTTMTGLLTLVQSHADPAVRGRVLSTLIAVLERRAGAAG